MKSTFSLQPIQPYKLFVTSLKYDPEVFPKLEPPTAGHATETFVLIHCALL